MNARLKAGAGALILFALGAALWLRTPSAAMDGAEGGGARLVAECGENRFGYGECLFPSGALVGGGVWSPPFTRDESWIIFASGETYTLAATDGSDAFDFAWQGERAYGGPSEGDPPLWGVQGADLWELDPWNPRERLVVRLPEGFKAAPPEGSVTLASDAHGALLQVTLARSPDGWAGTASALASPIEGQRPHRVLPSPDGGGFVNAEGSREGYLVAPDGTSQPCPEYAHPYLSDGWVYGIKPGGSVILRTRCAGDEEVVMSGLPPVTSGPHVSAAAGRVAVSLELSMGSGQAWVDGAPVADYEPVGGRNAARLSPSGELLAVNDARGLLVVRLQEPEPPPPDICPPVPACDSCCPPPPPAPDCGACVEDWREKHCQWRRILWWRVYDCSKGAVPPTIVPPPAGGRDR